MIWQELNQEGKVTESLIQGELQWIEYKDNLSSYSEKLKATQDRIDFLNSLRW